MNALDDINEEKKESERNENIFKLATVTGLFDDGCPIVKLYGDQDESKKKYSYLSTYIPEVGDTVLLCSTNETYVIIGCIKYNEAPENKTDDNQEDKNYLELSKNGAIILGNIGVYNEMYSLKLHKNLKHDGQLGFFGTSPTSKKTVSTLTSNSDLSNVITKLNSLIKALNSYGLV